MRLFLLIASLAIPTAAIPAAAIPSAPALADRTEIAKDWDVAGYTCRTFQDDQADPERERAAAQYAAVYLHVALDVFGLPLHPLTVERERTLLQHVGDRCRAEGDADFRLMLTRYLRSQEFRDWWTAQDT